MNETPKTAQAHNAQLTGAYSFTPNSRPPRKCQHPGCPNFGDWVNHGGRCPEHEAQVKGRRVRPMEKLYATRRYKDRYQPRVKSLNPICQKLTGGEQCHNPSTDLHHLVEPRTIEQFYEPHNCCMLCHGCHSEAGSKPTPHWVEGKDYVATVWQDVSFGPTEDEA